MTPNQPSFEAKEAIHVEPLTEVQTRIVETEDFGEIIHKSRMVLIDGVERERTSASLTIDGVRHDMRTTQPAYVDPDGVDTMTHHLGLTEMIDAGTGRHLHNGIAHMFPDKRTVSFSTPGIGKYAERIGFKASAANTFEKIAGDRVRLINHCTDEGKSVDAIGVSMSTVTLLQAVKRMQFMNVVLASPAIVEEKQAPKVMIKDFLPHMALNGISAALKHPRDIASCANYITALQVGHIPALAGNIWNLLHGSSFEDVDAAAKATNLSVIAGGRDPLFTKMRKQWEAVNDDNESMNLVVLENEGHALTLNSKLVARLMGETLNHATSLEETAMQAA